MDWNKQIGDMTQGELMFSIIFCILLWSALTITLYYPIIKANMSMKKHPLLIRIRMILGQKYLLNKASGEIHLLTNTRFPCHIGRIAGKNKKFLTADEMHKVRIHGRIGNMHVNGCRWCLGKFDTD